MLSCSWLALVIAPEGVREHWMCRPQDETLHGLSPANEIVVEENRRVIHKDVEISRMCGQLSHRRVDAPRIDEIDRQ